MKAVVVEVKKSYVAVLQEDGCISKLKNTDLHIGDTIQVNTTLNQNYSYYKRFVSIAAIFVLVVSASIFTYAMPVYYVSVDVNPSILMKANIFERIIRVEAMNEDALPILKDLNLKNASVEAAVTKVMESLNDKGYFETAGTDLVIATSSKNEIKSEKLARKIEKAADIESDQEGTEIIVDSRGTGYDMVQKADELGITPGKLNIITHVLGFETPEEYQPIVDGVLKGDYSMKDLMSVYKQTKDNNDKENAPVKEKTTNAQGDKIIIDDTDVANPSDNSNGKALGTTKVKTSDEDTDIEETTNVNDQDKNTELDKEKEKEKDKESEKDKDNEKDKDTSVDETTDDSVTDTSSEVTTDVNITDTSTDTTPVIQEEVSTDSAPIEVSQDEKTNNGNNSAAKEERKELLEIIKDSKK